MWPFGSEQQVDMVRPSELPIYDDLAAEEGVEYQLPPPGALQQSVGEVRNSVADFFGQFRETYDYVRHVYDTGVAHTAGTLDYLQDETNLVPRATAITVGGLTGLLLAALRRRGLVKRLLYTSVGLAVPTAICYPAQTEYLTTEYARWASGEAAKYGPIAYNFIIGAKPEEEPSPAANASSKKAALPKPSAAAEKPQEPTTAVEPVTAAKVEEPQPEPAANAEAPEPEPAAPAVESAPKPVKAVVPDPGQANPEDADLYTTRSG